MEKPVLMVKSVKIPDDRSDPSCWAELVWTNGLREEPADLIYLGRLAAEAWQRLLADPPTFGPVDRVAVAKFRKKPVVVEAVQWDGSADTANRFLGDQFTVDWWYESCGSSAIVIPTLEGNMVGQVGDWIIKGVKGEFYPCRADIFEATYEPVE